MAVLVDLAPQELPGMIASPRDSAHTSLSPVHAINTANHSHFLESLESSVDDDIVLFAQRNFYCTTSAGQVKVQVIRLGGAVSNCSVKLTTDASNKDHVSVSTELKFEAGERVQEVEIQLKQNNVWQNTQLIPMFLEDPKGAVVGEPGLAHLILADISKYPRGDTEIPSLISFLKLQIKVRGIKYYQTCAAMCYLGSFGVIDSYILKLVIDNALGRAECDEEENRDVSISLGLAGAYVFCFALSHYFDVLQRDKRGRSGTRKWLRNALMLKYLNLSEFGHQGLLDGDFLNCLTFQVEQLVGDGWYQWLLIIKYTVMVLMNLLLQVVLTWNKIPVWAVLGVFVVILPLIAVTLRCRKSKLVKLISNRQEAEDRWVAVANSLIAERSMIKSYDVSGRVIKKFSESYEEFYNKHRTSRFYHQTSKWIPRWGLAAVIATLYATAPVLVETFGLSAGDFAALIKSWIKVKRGVEAIHGSVLKMQRSTVALKKVSSVLNRESECEHQVLQNYSDKLLRGRRDKISADALCPETFTTVAFKNVSMSYSRRSALVNAVILKDTTVQFSVNGRLIFLAVHGESLAVNRKILRMIYGLTSPAAGYVSVPRHKRAVLLDRLPTWSQTTLLENIRFGMKQASRTMISEDACWAAAQACGLSQAMLSRKDMVITPCRVDEITARDAIAISLTRAILSEPQILLVDHFGDSLGPVFTERFLLPVFRMLIKGGLREVVSSIDPLAAQTVERSPFAPAVIWSSHVTHPAVADEILLVREQRVTIVPKETVGTLNLPWVKI